MANEPKKAIYTEDEFIEAFKNWQRSEGTKERSQHWDTYCDIRDGLQKGESKKKRIGMEKDKPKLILLRGLH